MNKLAQLRDVIASLDETLVKSLCGRAAFKVNAELYNETAPPCPVVEIATQFGEAKTIAGRARVLRPLYVNALLPALCESGADNDRRKCIAADANCMNALVQRLNLAVHVAALKLEEMPDALRVPLMKRDAGLLEKAVTNHTVEAEVVARILDMPRGGQADSRLLQKVAHLYETHVIPISRKIQVHDLLVKYR